MKKTFLATLTLGTLFAGSSYASLIITQTKDFNFTPTGSADLIFSKFDTMGGTRTLLGVTVTTSVTKVGGSLYIDNDSLTGGSGTISQTVTISLSGRNLTDNDGNVIASQQVSSTSTHNATVGADDGDGLNAPGVNNGFQSGGVDYDGTIFGNTTSSRTADVGSDNLTGYRTNGVGTYTINAAGLQGIDVNAISGVAGSFSPAGATGSVTITYTYVPEPSAALLGGLGLLALLRRRR